jgi:hypothetical protein
VLVLLAVLPIVHVGAQVARWTRNIPIWDEFDTALDLLIALDATPNPSVGDVGERLFALQNEHRTVVSRLIFATGYWLGGGINFIALAVLGNLFLAGVFWCLLAQVRESAARLRLAAIFSLVVLQLQHHENLYWSGASIDHFLVIMTAVASLAAIMSRGRGSLWLGIGLAFLATFSLVHGMLVWPIGAIALWRQHRRRGLLAWLAAAAGSIALFSAGFQINPGHPIPGYADLPRVLEYWLTLIGSSPALENQVLAPWLGGAVVITAGLLAACSRRTNERLPLGVVAWCLGSLALIAWGRALLSNQWAPITSRYIILSSIPCALVIWLLAERFLARRGGRGEWQLGALFALLASFNLAANQAHESAGRVFAGHGEKAVAAYHRDRTFAKAQTQLYPDPDRADALIRAAHEHALYQLPALETLRLADPEPIVLTAPEEIDDGCYFIEEVKESSTEVRVRGWAFRPDHTTRAGDVSLVFRSGETTIAFETTPQMRPDVAEAFERPDATQSGFELWLARDQLPPGEFGIGVCFDLDDVPEYMMTANTIVIPPNPEKFAGQSTGR